MNKEKFLMELREYLSILENQEQEDILDEYAQHIDMKMQKGLSEEEAIRDFGPMKELAAQILEAYHVKPEFRERGILIKLPQSKADGADGRRSFLKCGIGWCKRISVNVMHRIGNGFRNLRSKCHAFGDWLARPFAKRKAADGGEIRENRMNREGTNEMGGKIGNFFRMMGHGIVILWKWLLVFCMFWLRICWNAAWLLFSMFCAFMALIALAGFGAIIIFLFQGYPFVGIFILSIGGILCFGSLAYGAFSMIIRKKKDEKEEKPEISDEEVAYEQTA